MIVDLRSNCSGCKKREKRNKLKPNNVISILQSHLSNIKLFSVADLQTFSTKRVYTHDFSLFYH